MDMRQLLAVTNREALQFFYEHLRDLPDRPPTIPQSELLYNASVLAHFASTSTASGDAFPPTPANLSTVFDVFVLDRSQHQDAEIMEAAAAQCLVLTGFFADESVNSNLTTNLSGYIGKTLWIEQVKASVLTLVISFAGTFVLASIIKLVIGLRPSVEDEVQGLDYTDHGESGYHTEEQGAHVTSMSSGDSGAEAAATHSVAL